MTFVLPYRLTPDQDQKNIVNGTQQNFDAVTTALNSNALDIVQSGSLTLPTHTTASPGVGNYGSESLYLATVNHGLGYRPAVLAYIEFSTGARALLPYAGTQTSSTTVASWYNYNSVVTGTFFGVWYITTVFGAGLTTLVNASVKYYLLQEPAE